MAGQFDGLEVLDLTAGMAGQMAAMLLSDQGARVTRIERPRATVLAGQPGPTVWNRGKRSAELDLTVAADKDAFLALVDRADVVVEDLRPGATARLGIDPDTLLARNPRLVHCTITPYGTTNEHAGRPGYEALVAARTGSQWAQRGGILSTSAAELPDVEIPEGAEQAARPDGPLFVASPWMSLNGFYQASLGIAAALVARERTGLGQHVATSLLPRSARPGADTDNPLAGGWMQMKGAPRGLFECGDGRWVHHWALKPLTILQAAEHDRLEDAPPPSYESRRNDPNRVGMEAHVIIELFHWLPLLQAAFKKFPAQDWADWAERVNEGVQVVRAPEEALQDDALVTDGCVVTVDDPELGAIRHLGVITDFSVTQGTVRGPAPRRGEHTAEVRAEAMLMAPPPASPTGRSLSRPLEGVTVLDLGLALAGPFSASLLADMGADVVKVNAPWDHWWLETAIGQMANRGKRSVALNLQTKEGLETLHQMVTQADIVVHNMRWGVAERIGVGYDDLRKHNPAIIYGHSRGFDRVRSARNLPGTDQMGSALGGQEWEDGGCDRGGRPFFGTSMGDLGNGFLLAIGCVQALYHRDRTGEGQYLGTSILNACLATSSNALVLPDGTPMARGHLDGKQLGFSARYRLYETAEGWLCLAALTDAELAALRTALGIDLPSDDAALADLLERTFATRPAADWFRELDAAGVPVEVSSPDFQRSDADQPAWRFSATPAMVVGRAPKVGEHTRELLAQFGFSDDQVDALIEAGAAFEGGDLPVGR
jgi:crotonobetainyl-CoA:carnitine CoA-transferase CaiB-like acyl-CoA transferase